jgi:DNA-packaging protein gp3
MPIGILILYMAKKKYPFTTANELNDMTGQYFNDIEEKHSPDEAQIKNTEKGVAPGQKLPKSKSQQITITGLALHLGFSSRQAFEDYETKGKFADHLKRARLQVVADYEKELHVTSSTGAIFALKSMSWNERTEKPADIATNNVLKVKIIQSGPKLASFEKEVIL